MAVVKANGYGHGAVDAAHTFARAGAHSFGVARLSEAIALRKSGLQHPILVFGYTPPTAAAELLKYTVTQSIFSLNYALSLNENALKANGRIKTHIKIDTGMGRLGFVPHQLFNEGINNKRPDCPMSTDIRLLYTLDNLEIEGIFTHFAASDQPDQTSARQQLEMFNIAVSHLEAKGLHFPIKHAANSGAVLNLPEAHFDMVRPGIMLYGLHPSSNIISPDEELQPAMQIKALIAQIKEVPKGFKVSYGHTYQTPGKTRLATIPIGYADGFSRHLSSSGNMLVRGEKAPVVGRVCMDQTIIDVGHIHEAKVNDEVVILGAQKHNKISAEEVAQQLGTINYEIVSTLMQRVPRYNL